ncbi:urease accessory protein-like protein UreD [Calycina marina]|uniref:Urease accessory protein-like protein UreD n=1 Tax=Calycina marina TaxID=1763456 RepID=A0A9P7Z1J0_9HELO|nr:urease accessory protein-like protein UreD [Calycina marina]
MNSPFPASSSAPGEGKLVVELLPQKTSALSTITSQYPLKLISPSPQSYQKSVLVFFLTYGGGLVGGDQVHLTIDVKANSKLSIVTQGHTKIFKSPSSDVVTRQQLQVTLEAGAAVCLLPDPVQPFKGSVYEQSQIFTLHETASLCLLDWVSAGRIARGEDWDFSAWSGRNEVWAAEPKARLLLRDNVILEGDEIDAQDKKLEKKMHNLDIFGTLVLRGPLVENLAAFLLAEFAALPRLKAQDFRSQAKIDRDLKTNLSQHEIWRRARLEQELGCGLLWSAAKIRGCIVVKFGSLTVEGARTWIGNMIKEQGSVEKTFGESAIMCIK